MIAFTQETGGRQPARPRRFTVSPAGEVKRDEELELRAELRDVQERLEAMDDMQVWSAQDKADWARLKGRERQISERLLVITAGGAK
jgi:hypothetical protein